ncbi:unnamed protein product [Mesocestoides corti]|uniref:Uncharacterized protein n=1 Tax=Mesocestoides corti TaxID=53468 RepID=A0A0R3UNK9_MESCO|nr:unnamed protein product [Mesocestoides corti]
MTLNHVDSLLASVQDLVSSECSIADTSVHTPLSRTHEPSTLPLTLLPFSLLPIRQWKWRAFRQCSNTLLLLPLLLSLLALFAKCLD